MREDRVETVKIDAHLTESHEGAGARVDEGARDAVDEDDIARRCATEADGPAGAEDGELED